jgi:hypothetical protein
MRKETRISPKAGKVSHSLVVRRGAALLRTPETWVLVAALVQIAISWWWIGTDTHTPDAETARQLGFSFDYVDKVRDGDLLAPFRGTFNAFHGVTDLYPPIHGLLATVWSLIFGKSISGVLTAQTLIYLPLMVIGSYGAGRELFGRWGGALTAIFVMAIPAFGPMFHLYLVDTATLAFAAPAIWLLLLSRRFERSSVALAAGVVVGLGMLTKTNFAFMWPGFAAVMLVRGGWRHWRGVALFAGALLVVALPWYLTHLDELRRQVDFYSGDTVFTYTPSLGELRKYSLRHLSYYPRALLETNVYLPLLVLFAAGTVASIVRFVRRRSSADYTPELLAGLLVFWIGLLNVDTADWRFCLPAIVYVALLGAGWIVRLPRPAALAGGAVVALLFGVNTVMANFGVGKDVTVAVHGVSATVVSPKGIVVSKPNGVSRLPEELVAARKAGITGYWVFPPTEAPPDFTLPGLGAMAGAAGLRFVDTPTLGRNDVGVLFRAVRPGDPPPCSWITERRVGAGAIYLARGPVSTKRLQDVIYGADPRSVDLICPRP